MLRWHQLASFARTMRSQWASICVQLLQGSFHPLNDFQKKVCIACCIDQIFTTQECARHPQTAMWHHSQGIRAPANPAPRSHVPHHGHTPRGMAAPSTAVFLPWTEAKPWTAFLATPGNVQATRWIPFLRSRASSTILTASMPRRSQPADAVLVPSC